MTWKHIRAAGGPRGLLRRSASGCAQICAAEVRQRGRRRINPGEFGPALKISAPVRTIPAHRTLFVYRFAERVRTQRLIVKKGSTTMPAEKKESADKPGSVEDNHSSGIRVAAYLKRPTREPVWATRAAPSEDGSACSPIWSCSGRGLPCHRVLPPARCALTAPFHPYRPLCRGVGGLLSVALSVGSRPPGVTWRLALGARTFLHACAQRLPGRLRA